MKVKQIHVKPAAVILSLSATGLSVARSLGSQGVEVYGVDSSRLEIGQFSKYVQSSSKISFKNNTEQYIENLIEYAKNKNTRPVLFVAADDEIQIISEYSELLNEHFIMPRSYTKEFTGRLLNKIHLYEECKRIGIEIPVTFFPKNSKELKLISKKVPYPAIIKPDFRHEWQKRLKGRKVIEVRSPAELLTNYDHYCRDAEEVVVQEIIPGKEENIAIFGGYFNRDSEPLSVFTAKKTRQYPPMFGSGSLCESHWYPDIAEMSIDLVQKMRYHGICGTEYKWDPRDSKWKFMEINFRPTLWFAITRATGVDIVYDAYRDFIGQDFQKKIGTQKNGVLWQYLIRDCISFLHYLRKGEIDKNALKIFLNPRKQYAVISAKDWQVNFMYPFYILYQFLKYL